MDLGIGVLVLVALAPLMAAIAALIVLDGGGPVLFGQERIGRYGKPFTMWKFRSMYPGSDDREHRSAAEAWFAGSPAPLGYKAWKDRRVTRVGRVLRRTSLDELPQFVNVVRGEMSLVGPRPAIPYELALYENSYFERQAVRPGITGMWQVLGRDRLPATAMMALDRRYVRECSPALDFKILAYTIPSLLGRRPRNL
ncbi:MAG TPA: sugar transferase [Candidatus Dormibacteraeota bacterium]|nr:sugar transferase [Candidatus Dormibacteraeota bacterium]